MARRTSGIQSEKDSLAVRALELFHHRGYPTRPSKEEEKVEGDVSIKNYRFLGRFFVASFSRLFQKLSSPFEEDERLWLEVAAELDPLGCSMKNIPTPTPSTAKAMIAHRATGGKPADGSGSLRAERIARFPPVERLDEVAERVPRLSGRIEL